MLGEAADQQLLLPLGPVRNSQLFSNHWLRHRLPLEPEWLERRQDAAMAMEQLAALWKIERPRLEKYGSEAQLEKAFIQPVIELLGWRLLYQTHISGRRPDYALFSDDENLDAALDAEDGSPEFWARAALVADAKAWHVSLDRPSRGARGREYPPEQIEWYLDRTRLDWGLITNGRLWRLIPRELPPGRQRFQTYLEVDLPALLDRLAGRTQLELGGEDFAEFMFFFLFFGPTAVDDHQGRRTSLLERARLGSSEYAVGVSEDLRDRVFEALRVGIQGFLDFPENMLDPAEQIEVCREQSLVLLYRLLFVMYAEDRSLLPYRRNDTYTKNRSLARVRDEIAANLRRRGANAYRKHEVVLWEDLKTLFDLVDAGHGRYGVPPYNGGLFAEDKHPFLSDNKIGDFYIAQVIDQLGRSWDRQNPERGLFRVDYRDLAIRQLGSVYEGLLELRPRFAKTRMRVVRTVKSGPKVERIIPADATLPAGFREAGETIPEGTVYLETEKGERRATGSYYTPDHVVDHIVEGALGPLCRDISERIASEVAETERRLTSASDPDEEALLRERLEQISGEFDDRVLRLKVLDPAMGSGHFLVRACQYLAEEIATNPYTSDHEADELGADEPTLVYWKRKVAEHCLYGVDSNPMAVELAKLGLWLETVSTDQPFTFLDHHLRLGNSLVGATVDQMGGLPGREPLFTQRIRDEFAGRYLELAEQVRELSDRPSVATEDVRAKERGLRRVEKRLGDLVALGDTWCATYFAPESLRPADDGYAALVQTLSQPKKFAERFNGSVMQSAREIVRREVAPFHWEMEFLEVFTGQSIGFDAVVGNPPYDVLSTKETGIDVAPLKAFLREERTYDPSFRGKNNLYKLFICRAVELLRDQGQLGFIVPMPLLGDDQAVQVRERLLETGRFTQIDAFPQKDDPRRRVFPEAKLSTVVFTWMKGASSATAQFPSIRHPAAEFDDSSPRLLLTTEEIPQYDPTNLTVVSCAQEDWDLAVRLFTGSRMIRLGEVASCFQGEVNETTDRRRGFVSDEVDTGPEVLRGASIGLYAVREASQGVSKYLRNREFLASSDKDSKAWYSQMERVGFQRSSPQNNFRRLVAARIPADNFCFDTVSFVPVSTMMIRPGVLLALLNSALLDWYFRLGSTNSKVNNYQFENLPCPRFALSEQAEPGKLARLTNELDQTGPVALVSALPGPWFEPPFPPEVEHLLTEMASKIERLEARRGAVAKRDRSRLCEDAIPYQQAIDQVVFRLAGLKASEVDGIMSRLGGLL